MAGGGAVVAIIAAKQRRVQEIIDAFRLADATSADRAKGLETIGLMHSGELKDLVVEGVLIPGARDGTYYLSEASVIYRRDDRRGVKAVTLVVIIVLAIGLVLLPLMAARG